LRVSGSVGIVVYPDDGTDADVMLKHADFAIYHAKDQGRNNYQFFEPGLNVCALERQMLESGLRRAIDGRERADTSITHIVNAVVGMGRNLDEQVAQVGVESRKQLTCLRVRACPQGQSFYLSQPLTAAEFTRLCCRNNVTALSSVM